jgi:ubiquinone/menaquinone biosynthesis C-methylase UbiE
MKILPVKVRERVWHVEPGFDDPGFVAEYSAQTGKYPVEFRPVLDFLACHLDPAQPIDVLEIGPGPGWMSILFAKAYPAARITGIDVSPTFAEIARENSRREGVADRVTFAVANAERMDAIPDHHFDVVMSNQCLHYWPAPERVFNQIDRLLKPTGVFCLSADRRDMTFLGRVQYWLGRCSLSRRISQSWSRSVAGCLTVAEAAAALERSPLHHRARVIARHRTLQICSP